MKATAFLTTVLAVSMIFASCKDNTMDVQSVPQGDTKNAVSTQDRTLIWSHDGMKIEGNGESVIERELVSSFAQQYVYDVMITFDAWTTPETDPPFPTYAPELSVYNGDENTSDQSVISESGSYEISRYHTVYTNLGGFNPVKFYIALRCSGSEGECRGDASLRISNIKIFRLD